MLSRIFRPQYFPLVGFVVLFMTTFLSLLPWVFKAVVLLLVAIGTIVLPQWFITLWRCTNGWEPASLRLRENRFVPFLANIASYSATLFALGTFHLPRYMGGILIGALLTQIACTITNIWWKVSTHCAGSGAVIGALMAYSIIFYFNPVWWLCLTILISGLVGSSRMLLRQHTLMQVVGGTCIGTLCGFLGIMAP